MPRLRRYRVFLVLAVLVTFGLYRFTSLPTFDAVSAVGVSSFKSLGLRGQDITASLPKLQDILKEGNGKPPVVELPHVKDTKPTETTQPAVPAEEHSRTIHSTPTTSTSLPPTLAKPLSTSYTPSADTLGPEKQGLLDLPDGVIDESGKGRVETVPLPPELPVTHWVRQPEHHPIPSESIIQLPSGTPKPIPRIQHVFEEQESAADRAGRLEKLKVIKKTFLNSWQGYKEKAWMHDEVKPTSGGFKDPFCGWGATLVDTLDTLWMMGLEEEFEEAIKAVALIDFTTTVRNDIPLFETVIRYLGGLVAAYDVSGAKHKILLDKAVQLAQVLFGAFDTPNRMPLTFYYWKPTFASQPHRASARVVLAELGSLSLEFTRLAQLTGEPKYYDAIARITDAFDEWQMHTKLPGLWPLSVDASGNCAKPKRISASSAKPIQLEGPQMIPGPGSGLQAGMDGVAGTSKGARLKRQLDSGFPLIQTPSMNSSISSSTSPVTPPQPQDDCIAQGLASPFTIGIEEFSVASQADSTYEYLPKEYILLGGLKEQYRSMYENSVKAITEYLLFRPMTRDNADILFAGSFRTSGASDQALFEKLVPSMGHLSCFVGGMYALGSRVFDRPSDLQLAEKLTEGCVWAYNATVTGIMPEEFQILACDDRTDCAWNETRWWHALDPSWATRTQPPQTLGEETLSQLDPPLNPVGELGEQIAKLPVSSEIIEASPSPTSISAGESTNSPITRPNSVRRKRQLEEYSQLRDIERLDATPVRSYSSVSTIAKEPAVFPDARPSKTKTYTPPLPPSHEGYVKARIEDERLPSGVTKIIDRRYILRPEAIESIFYLYRITGSDHWRDAGWRMFQAIEAATRTTYGYSAIRDVTARAPVQADSMESFWLAETLKYFWLLFSEADEWSLDDWVFNTEAHPFKRPK